MIPTIIIISFILDGITSNIISLNSLFAPLFTLMSLLLIYPYFNNDKEKYYIACFVTGLAYDLIYTDTIIINAILFTLLGFIITRLNLILSNNSVNVTVMALVIIVIYRLIMYILLLMTGNIVFEPLNLLKGIYSSLISNFIFAVLGYIITDKISQKFKLKKAN